jgi:hypothetical protein
LLEELDPEDSITKNNGLIEEQPWAHEVRSDYLFDCTLVEGLESDEPGRLAG